jgi:hypothetical protein
MGENYQSKTQYGSSYKKHLSRSVFQIEAREGDPDERRVTIRHKKTNFGPLMDPFGAKITFEHQRITVEADALTQAELAEEVGVNTSKRILTALEAGPMFPAELQEALGVTLKTIKNRLTDLRNAGKVRETGVTSGQSQQVELAGVPSVPIPIRDSTGDTLELPKPVHTPPDVNCSSHNPEPPVGDHCRLVSGSEFKKNINWPAFENRGLWEAVAQIWDEAGDDFKAEWNADLAEYRERYGPYYSIYTPQQLLYVHIRDYGGGLIPGDLLQEEAA